MSERESKGGGSIPWANMAALFVAVVGGLSLLLEPLVSSRPQKGSRPVEAVGDQDVDARLWQDPLRVSIEHFEKAAAAEKGNVLKRTEAHLQSLKDQVNTDRAKGAQKKLLILPVAIPGGPYAEDNERRLRSRHAVVSGLAASGFTPRFGDHIGYFLLPEPDRALYLGTVPVSFSANVVPFEWFVRDYPDAALKQSQGIEHVLIIWLRDDFPNTQWLGVLHDLGEALDWNAAEHMIRVIGPASSTSLNRLLSEDAEADGKWKRRLEGVEIFSAMPTASEEVMALGLPLSRVSAYPILNSGPTLYRTINTDEEVAAALIKELKRRHVNLPKNVRLDKKARETADETTRGDEKDSEGEACAKPPKDPGFQHVAVIAEWDTLYGRSLPLTFLGEIFRQSKDQRDLREFLPGKSGALSSGSTPEWFHSFTYLRGIDGRLPTEGTPEKSKPPQEKETAAAAAPREGTEGEDQSDYLRRLAQQLSAMHQNLKRTGSEGLKAVGILGSDVYDKLMVLRALRAELPGVLFFTNNLDARLGLKEEWRATHNLIVASPFGLSLEARYQRNIAPFRDSYQTSVFASTLMITGVMPRPTREEMQSPRVFEIARRGPWDLSDEARSFDPERRDICSWWGNSSRVWSGAVMGLGFLALLLWIVITAGWVGVPKETAEGWHFRSMAGTLFANTGATAVFAVFVGTITIWWIYRSQPRLAEPLAFTQGISIWPTEIVRVIVILLCVHFWWKSQAALRRSNEEIMLEHGLAGPKKGAAPAVPPPWKGWFRRLARSVLGELKMAHKRFVGRHWGWRTECLEELSKCQGESSQGNPLQVAARLKILRRVKAETLWQEYLERGRWSQRLWRFGPLVFFYLIGGAALFLLLGIPAVPARGDRSFNVDLGLLVLTILSTTALLFYVVDAIRLNSDLIELFNQGITVWPESARLHDPRHRILSEEELAEYLDIRLIAARTEVVCPLVNYPFVILVLMIVARNSYFDNWEWPASLITILALNLSWAIYCSVQLYWAARRARRTALDRLSGHRLQALHTVGAAKSDAERERLQTRVKLIEETGAEISALRRGAFAPLGDQPFFRAILFSSGGIGIGSLLQYLPSLF
jgi:hypothetical protein